MPKCSLEHVFPYLNSNIIEVIDRATLKVQTDIALQARICLEAFWAVAQGHVDTRGLPAHHWKQELILCYKYNV